MEIDTEELYSAFELFGDVNQLILLFGLIISIIGFLAWATNRKGEMRSDWGRRLLFLGISFSILGANFTWFLQAIAYVFS